MRLLLCGVTRRNKWPGARELQVKTVLNALALILTPVLALGQRSGGPVSLERTIKIDSRVLGEQRVMQG
jgi:hypothetical protein